MEQKGDLFGEPSERQRMTTPVSTELNQQDDLRQPDVLTVDADDAIIRVDTDPVSVLSLVRLEERAPNTLEIRDDDEQSTSGNVMARAWSLFGCREVNERMVKKDEVFKSGVQMSRSVRSYYKGMDELLAGYARHANDIRSPADGESGSADNLEAKKAKRVETKTLFLAKASFFVNLALLILKGVAAVLSGSLSVISSLVDSAMDLISGVIIWITSSQIKSSSPYLYPTGQARLEPLSIAILSAIMGIASVQLIAESIQTIISLAKGTQSEITFDNITLIVLSLTMVSKLVLWILCRNSTSPSVQALSLDHRNDILGNAVAALCGYFGAKYWAYLDPIGAILIGGYIFINWWQQGSSQIKLLTGHTADPMFLSEVTWLALQHDARIQQIDTVRAYHFGNDFIVEVHIVLPEDMALKEAHDIGESLQTKIERMEKVERAFVHIDYESEHDPALEHKRV